MEPLSSAHAVIADTGRSVTAMHSATSRLISRFFIGGPSLSLGRKWSSGKMDALTSLNTRRAESFHLFSKKFKKKKKRKTRMLRWRHLLTIVTERSRILLMKYAGAFFRGTGGLWSGGNRSIIQAVKWITKGVERMDKKLNEAVAALRPQMVAALQRLVHRRSVEADPLPGKPFGEEVDACFAEALTLCHELGFETTDMDRYIGWCEIGTGDEMVAVLGHLDVVPEGEGWHHPPYAAEIEGGRLYGRGAIDDKGPVVASLFALKAIRDLGIPLNRRVRLLFGLNEETNDRDVLYYKAHGGEIPVLGFTPDGEYPLINGEKGILNESYAVQLHQTGAWQLNRVQGGVAGNVVPDYACAVLTAPAGASLPEAEHITVTAIPGGYQVEAVGVSAHGSHPEQGENAIGRLVCYLDRLPLEGDAKQAVHFLAEKLGTDPYGERLLGHRLEDALSGPMSCNWGLIEGDAQHLWVKLNYRYPVTMERADCQPAVQAAFEAAGWALDGQVHKEKLYYPAETPLVSALLEVYRDATGDNAPPKCIGGGTYAKMLPNVVAFGPLFAGDPVTEHQPDECIDLERLVQNAQIIANAIVKLANLPLE